jgi:hypothetical protein
MAASPQTGQLMTRPPALDGPDPINEPPSAMIHKSLPWAIAALPHEANASYGAASLLA